MGRPCLLSSCFASLLSTYQGHALFGQTLNLGESMDWPISVLTCLDYVSNFAGHTLWHSNIAMENGLFVDVIYICIHSIQYNSTSNKSNKKMLVCDSKLSDYMKRVYGGFLKWGYPKIIQTRPFWAWKPMVTWGSLRPSQFSLLTSGNPCTWGCGTQEVAYNPHTIGI